VLPTPPPGPNAAPAATPSSTPNSTLLPLGSSLFFVLDETISSHSSKAGSYVRAHLRDPLILKGITVAAAGTPIQVQLVQAQPAHMANEDGSVEIYLEPMPLAGGKTLPLSTPTARIDPHLTAGQASTRDVTDTVGDIFIPYHLLYHMLRKGMDVTLRPGTVIRGRTAAALDVSSGSIAIATPRPFPIVGDTPHPAFSPAPLASPPGFHMPTPKPTP